jgi:hypothetical protein
VEGSCEYGNEPSGFLKCREVPEWLHNWQLLTKSKGKGKVVPVLNLIKHYAMKAYGGVDV